MDQNQLSPYVKQDDFPLFDHGGGRVSTEFTELTKRVLTERVDFDLGFADAVFAETAGHPYLTVNVLTSFFEWMIDEKRRAADLHLHDSDFLKFASKRLNREGLVRSGDYDLFKNVVFSALSPETAHHDPWLFAVYGVLQAIAREDPTELCMSEKRFEQVAEPLVSPLDWDAAHLLNTATKANFLLRAPGSIRPAIPILARLAGASPRRVH